MALSISPTSIHEITRKHLKSEADLKSFGHLVLRCAVHNQEFFSLAVLTVGYNSTLGKFTENDFLDPVDGLCWASMQEFHSVCLPGTTRPNNGVSWLLAVQPHMRFFFESHPEYPDIYKTEAARRFVQLAPLQFGDIDRACDGLIDYVTGVRMLQAEAAFRNADPATRRKGIDERLRTIRIPGQNVEVKTCASIFESLLVDPKPTKPIATGVKSFDYHYGRNCRGGDAWLFAGHPGSGKTNLSCQTAAYTAGMGELAMYVTTEVKREIIMVRACSAHTGIPYKELMAVAGSHGMHPVSARFREWCLEGAGTRIGIFDYREYHGINYKEKFLRMLDDFHRTFGATPRVMIWDWIGKALDSDGFADSWAKREAYAGVANMMVDKAKELDNCSVTLAQASKETKGKTTIVESDTQDCKTLGDGMTGFCGITSLLEADTGNADDQSCYKDDQYFVIGKCREERTLKLPVTRCFSMARFESHGVAGR